jgi:hypothetical protein
MRIENQKDQVVTILHAVNQVLQEKERILIQVY